MTDEQIIKALECSLLNDIGGCRKIDALNLINRQKAEIDILIRKKETLRDEIAKLENEVETWKRTADYNAKKYAELVREMEGD